MRIICCKFGDKFTNWHVKNLKHMIDTYSGLKYNEFVVISSDLYGNWYNKLQMYDIYRDGENLYFDLDVEKSIYFSASNSLITLLSSPQFILCSLVSVKFAPSN